MTLSLLRIYVALVALSNRGVPLSVYSPLSPKIYVTYLLRYDELLQSSLIYQVRATKKHLFYLFPPLHPFCCLTSTLHHVLVFCFMFSAFGIDNCYLSPIIYYIFIIKRERKRKIEKKGEREFLSTFFVQEIHSWVHVHTRGAPFVCPQ